MKPLALVAASGLAREVIALRRLLGAPDPVAVLDDDPARWGTRLDGVDVVGPPDLVAHEASWQLVLCAGKGGVRRVLRDRLSALGVEPHRYATLVHPHVVVPPGCDVGRGCVVMGGVVMTAGVRVGDHVVLMPHVGLTHDVVVDDLATLCAGVSLAGAVHVREAAYVGVHASVREHVTVGCDAVVGMGAVVLRDVPDGQTWVGVPAGPLVAVAEAARPVRA